MQAYQAVISSYWAILPDTLNTIIDIARREGEGPEAVAAKLGRKLDNSFKTTVRGRTAIIPLVGPIFPRANMMTEASGATSLSIFSQALHTALENDTIDQILLDVDSPGGVAFGPGEMADLIAEAKSIKPIIAYVSGMCASAAYWITAACTEIVAHRTAQIGSIGVVRGIPIQEQAGSDGYKTYEIVSSNAMNKRPDPRTEEGLSVIRKELDDLESQFIESVASARQCSLEKVKTEFGGGGLFIAAEAVRAGMIDRIGSFESLLTDLNNPKPKISGGAMSTTTTQHKTSNQPESEALTAETIRTQHPNLAQEIESSARKAGYEEGLAAGSAAERERIKQIEAVSMPGHEELIAAAKADGTSTAADVAVKILAAEKARGNEYMKTVDAASASLPSIQPGIDTNVKAEIDPAAPIEERTKAKWDKNPNIRAEYNNNYPSFLAFEKNLEAGNIKILSK